MRFAKYYNVTRLVDDMRKKKKSTHIQQKRRINLLVYMFVWTQTISGFQELVRT